MQKYGIRNGIRSLRRVEQKARVTSKGQVTIPKAVRRALGIWEGDSLRFDLEDGEVRVRVERKSVSFADYAGAWREGTGMSIEEANAYVRDLRRHDDVGDDSRLLPSLTPLCSALTLSGVSRC
jgi:AbrB family looped-hinge helix DNA binding protein